MNAEVSADASFHFNLKPAAKYAPTASRRFSGLKVLLVDDDPADVSLILGVLKRHPNISVARAADSPLFALREIELGRLSPDLILLDIHMPRMNGFEFLRDLRAIPAMASVPVVLLTTSRLRLDMAHAVISSASMYIVKPDDLFDLQASLNGVIRRAILGSWTRPQALEKVDAPAGEQDDPGQRRLDS